MCHTLSLVPDGKSLHLHFSYEMNVSVIPFYKCQLGVCVAYTVTLAYVPSNMYALDFFDSHMDYFTRTSITGTGTYVHNTAGNEVFCPPITAVGTA